MLRLYPFYSIENDDRSGNDTIEDTLSLNRGLIQVAFIVSRTRTFIQNKFSLFYLILAIGVDKLTSL